MYLQLPLRKSILHFFQQRVFFLLFLISYILLSFAIHDDFGVAIDEPIEYRFGEMLYFRNFGKDPLLLRDFAEAHENSREIWAYNHFHAMLLFIMNDSASLEGYHFLNLLFATFAFYAAYELALTWTKKPLYALIGPILLFFTPRFFGDLASNVKDPVFATYYLLALTLLIKLEKFPHPLLRAILIGTLIGFAGATRVLGYGLLVLYGIKLGVDAYSAKNRFFDIPRVLLELVIATLTTVIVHGLQMPFVAANPLKNLPILFTMGTAYPWSGEMLYLGNFVTAGNLPWHYVFVWALSITPVFVLFFWFLSHRLLKHRLVLLLHSVIWINLALYFLLRPIIYDGIRHFLFLLVVMTVLASITWIYYWRQGSQAVKGILVVALVLHILSVSLQYLKLHPYQYTYFNELVGGLPGAEGKMETEYWGTSYNEAARWLKDYLGASPTVVGLCGNKEPAIYFEDTPHEIVWLPHCKNFAENNIEYAIVFGRNNLWEKVPGEVIHTISRDSVPLTKVFRIQ